MQKNGSYQAVFSVDLQTIQFSFHTDVVTQSFGTAETNPFAGVGIADWSYSWWLGCTLYPWLIFRRNWYSKVPEHYNLATHYA